MLDFGQQLVQLERLEEVVHHPVLRGVIHAFEGVAVGGDDDHRDVPQLFVQVEQLELIPPVQVRHHDVEQDEIRLAFLGSIVNAQALSDGFDVVALVFEELRDQSHNLGVVVDDQDLAHVDKNTQQAACHRKYTEWPLCTQ